MVPLPLMEKASGLQSGLHPVSFDLRNDICPGSRAVYTLQSLTSLSMEIKTNQAGGLLHRSCAGKEGPCKAEPSATNCNADRDLETSRIIARRGFG